MATWQYTKGLHDIGNGVYAYLQPDGSWGWSNAGLAGCRRRPIHVGRYPLRSQAH